MKKLKDIKELVDGHEYVLPVPILTLVNDGRYGGTKYLMRCGDRY